MLLLPIFLTELPKTVKKKRKKRFSNITLFGSGLHPPQDQKCNLGAVHTDLGCETAIWEPFAPNIAEKERIAPKMSTVFLFVCVFQHQFLNTVTTDKNCYSSKQNWRRTKSQNEWFALYGSDFEQFALFLHQMMGPNAQSSLILVPVYLAPRKEKIQFQQRGPSLVPAPVKLYQVP